ncbi:MAG TPA: prolyl-tRNA synthetase associated domain-containing protein [Syntrophaceticus sp.]|jgi:Ala-tRNA(Pro) deacylase|uniref:Prolyl-tRNA editing protein proX n=1 Tax=Syntrophaceticus schinkii TaxID=499207 RepID=A0A0B7MQT4_9FIRM|nr:prolyl-tRNA synthetase associated domain-containing protein [Syntrophaceticus schinkii]HHY30617.1 prolyl-tRNA synthetase associated domain-containing protein [Syntrophaceticus sp.]MDD2360267.1 prolyl-tRNA synthetase associated domain-containing protein [Syntrophaceticus schinkii]MDD4261693.1 prolyl-tRNA synthetase associated domain-containing protein [Syntrophaceticus schinkii]MDD4675701.1 prolyl-tRNA synthetase associated domain-containing protein [Syntrophaceticus schinkii]CEO90356.1 Prol
MSNIRQKVFDIMKSMNIPYDVTEHPAVYTMEEMEKLNIDSNNEVVKNLFIRDDKKKRFFLIVLQKNKRADLKEIRKQLNCRPLSFASEKYLFKLMGLNTGAVSPFGVLNDVDCTVEVVLDKDILAFERIGVHPNDNTATVWIRPQDLELIIRNHGNDISYIEI